MLKIPSDAAAEEGKQYADSGGHRSHVAWGDRWGTAGSHMPGAPLAFMHQEYDVYEPAHQLDVKLLSQRASITLARLFAASVGNTIPNWPRYQQVHRSLVHRVQFPDLEPNATEVPQGLDSQGSSWD